MRVKGDDIVHPSPGELKMSYEYCIIKKTDYVRSESSSQRAVSTSSAPVSSIESQRRYTVPDWLGEFLPMGPSSLSFHKLTTRELGVTVDNVKDVIEDGVFDSEVVPIVSQFLPIRDRAMFRTRVLATALHKIDPGISLYMLTSAFLNSMIINLMLFVLLFQFCFAVLIWTMHNPTPRTVFQTLPRRSQLVVMKSLQRSVLGTQRQSGSVCQNRNTGYSLKKQKRDCDDVVEMIPVDTTAICGIRHLEVGRKIGLGHWAPHSKSVSTWYAGESALHSRTVNFDSQIFSHEHKSLEVRKEILRLETLRQQRLSDMLSKKNYNPPSVTSRPVSAPTASARKLLPSSSLTTFNALLNESKPTREALNFSFTSGAAAPAVSKVVHL